MLKTPFVGAYGVIAVIKNNACKTALTEMAMLFFNSHPLVDTVLLKLNQYRIIVAKH
jgi:hypothetical protein